MEFFFTQIIISQFAIQSAPNIVKIKKKKGKKQINEHIKNRKLVRFSVTLDFCSSVDYYFYIN